MVGLRELDGPECRRTADFATVAAIPEYFVAILCSSRGIVTVPLSNKHTMKHEARRFLDGLPTGIALPMAGA